MAAKFTFACLDAVNEKFAAGPTLNFKLKVTETTGERVHAIALRVQLRIEPAKRRYSPEESERLNDLFGDPSRYADTLNPVQFTFANIMVPSFTDSIEIELPVQCTYDLEIGSTSYFHALREGEIPLLMLFSGTVFTKGTSGFSVAQVPWSCEAEYRLPVAEWQRMMHQFFPNSGWLRVSRETIDALGAFKNARALPTWEHAISALLDEIAASTEPRHG